MKRKTKIVIAIILVLSPMNAQAGIFDTILNAIGKVATTLSVASQISEVGGYPGEYVRMANLITADINNLKNQSKMSDLSLNTQKQVVQSVEKLTKALASSIDRFNSLLSRLSTASTNIADSSSPDIGGILRDIKTDHQQNMAELYRIHVAVKSLSFVTFQQAAGNATMDKVNKASEIIKK